eukprot:4291307-Pyramimonas_sp.AAC.2
MSKVSEAKIRRLCSGLPTSPGPSLTSVPQAVKSGCSITSFSTERGSPACSQACLARSPISVSRRPLPRS